MPRSGRVEDRSIGVRHNDIRRAAADLPAARTATSGSTYGRLYANDGAMTPGVDGDTPDGVSPDAIREIIDRLRAESPVHIMQVGGSRNKAIQVVPSRPCRMPQRQHPVQYARCTNKHLVERMVRHAQLIQPLTEA